MSKSVHAAARAVPVGNQASLSWPPVHRDGTTHATWDLASGIASANLFRTIRRCPRSRFALCDIPPINQQMGGYSAIATAAGTVRVLPDVRLCKRARTRFEVPAGGCSDRLTRIYIGIVRD